MYEYTYLEEKPYDRSTWKKIKTTRRYLHPPRAERLFTLWPEGKIIFGDEIDGSDVVDKKQGYEYYHTLISCGMWLLYGSERKQFDFKTVKYLITEDGAPIHGVEHKVGDLTVTEEAFCDIARLATCFAKVTLKNEGNETLSDKVSMVLRTGLEGGTDTELVAGGCDGYRSYNPQIEKWYEWFPSTWHEKNGAYTDGDRTLRISGDVSPVWDDENGAIDFNYTLKPNESVTLFFMLNRGEKTEINYDAELIAAKKFWAAELSRINRLPKKISDDAGKMKMIRHFVAQLLQCFTYPVGKDYLLWRQGGLQRIIWPSEADVCFEALSRIGDFYEYTQDILDTYFNVMQNDEGEIINIGIYWANITGGVLFSLAKHCENYGDAGRKTFDKYRDAAMRAFDWMKRTRRSTIGNDELVEGIFPPLRNSDWEQVIQEWASCDAFNIHHLKPFVELLERYNDPRASEVREEYEEYILAMKKHMKPILDNGDEDLYIPKIPVGDDKRYVVDELMPLLSYAEHVRAGVIDNVEDLKRMHNWAIKANRYNGGLTGRMISGSSRHCWYLSFPDLRWFQSWERFGEIDRMKEIYEDQLRWGVTDEYYMVERYDETDPYFLPWSPNASAMARVIIMMLSLFKD